MVESGCRTATIEERIEELLQQKKILFEDVVDELADISLERVTSEEELFGLFGLTPPRVRREGLRKGEAEAVPPPSRTQPPKAEVIRRGEPFSNLVRLRQILRESEEYIWWADRFFRARGLEELIVAVDPAVVRQLRILSGPDNVDERAKHDFVRFREELSDKGISVEWRILKGFAHDRWIVSGNTCYNVPSIDTILRGQPSEILETPNRPPFEEWWERAAPLDDSG